MRIGRINTAISFGRYNKTFPTVLKKHESQPIKPAQQGNAPVKPVAEPHINILDHIYPC